MNEKQQPTASLSDAVADYIAAHDALVRAALDAAATVLAMAAALREYK